MRFSTRWQRYRSTAVAWAWAETAYYDDHKFTVEDLDETLYAVAALGIIWSPQIAVGLGITASPLNILEGAVIAGAIASYGIGGSEGVKTYVDYITDPVGIFQEPDKTESFVRASDITLSLFNPLHIPQKKLATWIAEDLPWGEVFKNRWRTGPYLPF